MSVHLRSVRGLRTILAMLAVVFAFGVAGVPSLAHAAGPFAVGLTIRQSEFDIWLDWTHLDSTVQHYEVYRSAVRPYFERGSSDAQRLDDVAPPALGSRVSTYDYWFTRPSSGASFYAIWAVNSAGQAYRIASPVGTFASSLSQSASLNSPAFFVASDGNDANPGTIDAPWRTFSRAKQSLQPGVTVYVRGGVYNERVDLTRVANPTGPHITFAAFPGEEAVLDGTGLTILHGGGVFHVWDSDYIRVSGLKVRNSPAAGIYVAYSDHVIVEDNSTYNTVNSGVSVWGSNDVLIEGNAVALACNPGSEENITVDSSTYVEVRHNHVHDGPEGLNPARAGGEGINVKNGSSHVRVYDNVVHDIPKLAFGLDGWSQYTQDIEFFGNEAFDCVSGFIVESEAGATVENVRVYNNIAHHNVGPGLYIPDWMMNEQSLKKNVTFINNTSYANGQGIAIRSAKVENIIIRNNIFSRNGVQVEIIAGAAAQTIVDRNLFHGGTAVGSNPLIGDPLFADAVSLDFHLTGGSPAIDTASSVGAPNEDFDHLPRPQLAAYDLGAYEFAGD